jgi:MFS family permease
MEKEKFGNRVFLLFGLLTSFIGFNWFMWGPILSSVIEPKYKVSGFIVALFISSVPLMLVVLSYFAGSLADTNPKRTTTIAALFLAVTTILRPFAIGNFYLLLALQIAFSVSAVFCFTSWSPLTYRLFEKDMAANKIAIYTAFLTGGQILAFLITYHIYLKIGLFWMLLVYGLVSFIVGITYMLTVNKGSLPVEVQVLKRPSFSEGLNIAFKEKAMFPLSFIAFLDIGVFCWLAGWYPKMLTAFKGITPDKAGIVNSLILLGCLIGAMTVPNWSHSIKKVKIFLSVLPILCIAMFILVPYIGNYILLLVDGLVLGFALFPMYPLGVHLPSAYSKIGIAYAGVGSGIILISANLGGFLFPEIGSAVHTLWGSILIFGVLPMFLMFLIAFAFRDPDTYRQ